MKSPKGSDSRSSRSASKSDVDRFRGRFEVKLDPKGRLSLPPGLRLSENIVITNHRLNGRNALHGYTLESWQRLESRIERLSPLEASVQAFQRFYISGGQVVELDSQGRVLVPAGLRKFAGLEADVVVVGLGDKFEIWSAEVWNVLFGEMIEVFDQTLARIAVLDEKKGEER